MPPPASPEKELVTRLLTVRGVVQGVGFRPFVFRQATAREIVGWVLNKGSVGVEIKLTGTEHQVSGFVDDLRNKLPPLARVDDILQTELPLEEFETFTILPSVEEGEQQSVAVIPADAGICASCAKETSDTSEPRRGQYEFVACVDCGPRYSSIEGTPYDRPLTSYAEFPLCDQCQAEYLDPMDRRFHAQTTACRKCGPSYWILERPNTRDNAAIVAIMRKEAA